MAKKYLSLEEAADYLGISQDELKRHRENGDIRGFADRANWKFRQEDLDEFKRTLETDSSPDVPLFVDDDSDMVLDMDDDDELSSQPTVIRSESVHEDDDDLVIGPSDSDVRLVGDEDLKSPVDDGSEMTLSMEDSDSDVRLSDQNDPLSGDSDSDVRLVTDESDDVFGTGPTSDSDVRLIGDDLPTGSDSDVRLVGDSSVSDNSDSDVSLVPDDSDVLHAGSVFDEDSVEIDDTGQTMAAGSDVFLSPGDSGISLEAADSGISLEVDDEGSSILFTDDDDSDISLTADEDSGISLAGFDDSGISLDVDDDEMDALTDDDDSGISFAEPADSGIALEAAFLDDGDNDSTMPMVALPDEGDDPNLADTLMEVPTLDDDGSDFDMDFGGEGDGTDFDMEATGAGSDTGVIVFDDDEEVDDYSPTMKASAAEYDELEGDMFDMDEADEFGLSDDDYSADDYSADDYDAFSDDDLEVSADVLGEDDELDDLDVFDATDDDFDDGFQSGASHATFTAPAGAGMAAAPEQEWGIGTFLAVLVSTAFMGVCGMVMYDLMRSMWSWNAPTPYTSMFLDTLRGLF